MECARKGEESEKADRIKSSCPLCDLHFIVSGKAAGNASLFSFNLIDPGAGNAKLSRKFSQLLVVAYYFVVRCQSIRVQLQNISNIDLKWTLKRGDGTVKKYKTRSVTLLLLLNFTQNGQNHFNRGKTEKGRSQGQNMEMKLSKIK